ALHDQLAPRLEHALGLRTRAQVHVDHSLVPLGPARGRCTRRVRAPERLVRATARELVRRGPVEALHVRRIEYDRTEAAISMRQCSAVDTIEVGEAVEAVASFERKIAGRHLVGSGLDLRPEHAAPVGHVGDLGPARHVQPHDLREQLRVAAHVRAQDQVSRGLAALNPLALRHRQNVKSAGRSGPSSALRSGFGLVSLGRTWGGPFSGTPAASRYLVSESSVTFEPASPSAWSELAMWYMSRSSTLERIEIERRRCCLPMRTS